jgi:hypothetical protein
VDGTQLFWNAPYSEHPSRLRANNANGTTPPHNTQLGCSDTTQIFLRNVGLSQERPEGTVTGFAYGNNVVIVPMYTDSDPLEVYFWLYDYDSWFNAGDDVWCEGGETFEQHPWGDSQYGVFSSFTEYDNHNCHMVINIHPLEFR